MGVFIYRGYASQVRICIVARSMKRTGYDMYVLDSNHLERVMMECCVEACSLTVDRLCDVYFSGIA